MPDMDFDFSEIEKLAVDVGHVADTFGHFAEKAVEVTARNVKDDWNSKLEGARALPHAAGRVNYEIETDAHSIEATIEPRLGGQGSIIGLVELGTPTLAPRGYGRAALQENQEDFVRGVEKAAEDAERAAGL